VCPFSTREWQRSKPLLFSTRSFTDPYFDSCGIFTDVVISILATIAKQARIRLSERVQVGLARARSWGKRLVRTKRPKNCSFALAGPLMARNHGGNWNQQRNCTADCFQPAQKYMNFVCRRF
jgi:hypothetical protein